ncbi:uncharacterized protein LOC105840436 isoform X2 [Monomorium pharaonis]|uniref:uncharacterized protein LOC105840436 isoform X2 n=1 Tax=Monomorium pharaonis TaxID=307658 RepID=UPI0017466D74|nr:uncharacterized protein LOC105840436 isoform X2 [Monomorium pharaonis]
MEKNHIQIKDNLPSIEHILRPITYTSWLLGAGVAHPRKYPKIISIILCIIYFVLCFIVMIFEIKQTFDMYNLIQNIYSIVSFIQMGSYVPAYYCIYQAIGQYDKWPKLMDKIKEFDQKIRREILINDKPVKIAEVLAILVTFTCCPLCIIVDILYFPNTSLNEILSLLDYYRLSQTLINSFVFDVVVYVLYHRLQAINKLIGQFNEFSDALKIRRIRKMHNDICDLLIMVNDIYGFNLLFCAVNCLIGDLSNLLIIYLGIRTKINFFMWTHITFVILYTTQFGLMCWNCTLARREFDKTGIIIHAIVLNSKHMNFKLKGKRSQSNLEMRTSVEDRNSWQNSIWDSSHYWNNIVAENFLQRRRAENLRKNLNYQRIRNEINDFFIQLQHRRIVFTAYDFFDINNVAFSGFIGAIIVYMTICVQFFNSWISNRQLLSLK